MNNEHRIQQLKRFIKDCDYHINVCEYLIAEHSDIYTKGTKKILENWRHTKNMYQKELNKICN